MAALRETVSDVQRSEWRIEAHIGARVDETFVQDVVGVFYRVAVFERHADVGRQPAGREQLVAIAEQRHAETLPAQLVGFEPRQAKDAACEIDVLHGRVAFPRDAESSA